MNYKLIESENQSCTMHLVPTVSTRKINECVIDEYVIFVQWKCYSEEISDRFMLRFWISQFDGSQIKYHTFLPMFFENTVIILSSWLHSLLFTREFYLICHVFAVPIYLLSFYVLIVLRKKGITLILKRFNDAHHGTYLALS